MVRSTLENGKTVRSMGRELLPFGVKGRISSLSNTMASGRMEINTEKARGVSATEQST